MYVCIMYACIMYIYYIYLYVCVCSYDISMISGVDTGNFTVDHSTHYLMRGIIKIIINRERLTGSKCKVLDGFFYFFLLFLLFIPEHHCGTHEFVCRLLDPP